uniref:Integrase catalytic domain-containing protein n=1 Tax=Trichogramma kaykai TaxID=54128 RepID=A0ABD2W2Q2_9HYME
MWVESSSNSEVNLGNDVSRKLKVVLTFNKNDFLIDFSRFSSWEKLVHSVGRVLEAVARWRKREIVPIQLIAKAEVECIRISQKTSFSQEIVSLKKFKSVDNHSRVFPLSPFLDADGILRVESRISFFKHAGFSNNPILLDSSDYFTTLLIEKYHRKFYHSNHDTVINELRQSYWIVGLRRALKRVVSHCSICKILRAKPVQSRMAVLPRARLAFRLKPFTHCGLDYIGLYGVKVGRRIDKRWGALFTCMTTRAIHLELTHTLNADSAIMALRRFAARRGTPSIVYCYNGTNFKAMSKELSVVLLSLDFSVIMDHASRCKILWKFNPPAAPHMGGARERLVRSVKTALSYVLKEKHPSDEVLGTLLAEVEHCVNSRPLTHISSDTKYCIALTPNHFLLSSSSGQLSLPRFDKVSLNLRNQWKLSQFYADWFWKRWLHEYLSSLHPRKRCYKVTVPLKVDDCVLIYDENVKRNAWRKGVIIKLMPGSDGQVRVAVLRAQLGELTRPTNKLVKYA